MHNPAPLTAGELGPLLHRGVALKRFYAVVIPIVIACGTAAFTWSDVPWLRRVLLLVVIAAVIVATVLQLRMRCPRCNARLRTTMFLALPRRCGYCGVSLERAAG